MHAVMGSGRLIAGRYRLEGPIGRGAMGIVWHGRDELLARDVAVKEVQITGQASPADAETIYQRTLREARAAARLSHPGAVTVFDVVEENGSPWIVMEMVKGRSLDRVITEDGPLPPLQAAELGGSLVGALATAHAAGVLHRDVKPSNVLVTDEGRAVLSDFGIATFAGDPGQTQVGMVVGTPGFTAPERLRGDTATPASDLWSLGATLYAAVEGRGPFDRVGGPTAITAGVAKEDAPRAPSAGPLGPVIDALLSRDPSIRPDSPTASRLLAEAAAAAVADPAEQRAAFLDPPVFAELSMPERADRPDDLGGARSMPAIGGLDAIGLGGGADQSAPASVAVLGAGSGASLAGHQAGQGDAGPVLWQPLRRAPDGSGSVGPATGDVGTSAGDGDGGTGSGGSGSGGNDGGRFLRGGPARPTSGRWRLLAGAGIATIAAAAIVAWYLYSRTPTTAALQNPAVPGITAAAGSSPANHGSGGSGAGGNQSGTAPAAGGKAPTTSSKGQQPGSSGPSSTSSSSPGSSPSPPSSPSASPSPSPSPSLTVPVLPPGYVWHRFTAAVMGTAAGFEIGMPSSWQQSVTALSVHLSQPVRDFHLTVNLAPWTYAGPLAQAQYLQLEAAKTDKGYKDLSLGAIGFRAVGGFRTAPAAELKFSWTNPSLGSLTEVVILVTFTTKSGVQPYTFTMSAPSATFSAARGVLYTAMPTFRPLPGA